MLYVVFLHELGHLQIIDKHAKTDRRRFAGETRAQDFADHWRRELWAQAFDHLDPVHGPPSSEETKALRDGLKVANSDHKRPFL